MTSTLFLILAIILAIISCQNFLEIQGFFILAAMHISFLFAVIDSCSRKPQSPLSVTALILSGIIHIFGSLLLIQFALMIHPGDLLLGVVLIVVIMLGLFIFAIIASFGAISLKLWQIFAGLFFIAFIEFFSFFGRAYLVYFTLFTIAFLAFRELARFLILKLRSREKNREIQKIQSEK